VDSIFVVRACGVVSYAVVAGRFEVDSMPVVRDGVVSYDVVIGFFVEVDSIEVVRAYGVVCYGIAAGLVEVDSKVVVRAYGVVSYDVVAGRFEIDSIVVVRGVYLLYSTVIRVVEMNSSYITSSPGHGESAYVNVICSYIEDVVMGIESFYNRVRRVLRV